MKINLNDHKFKINEEFVSMDHFAIIINEEQPFEEVAAVVLNDDNFSLVEVLTDTDEVLSSFTGMVNGSNGYHVEKNGEDVCLAFSVREKNDSDKIKELENVIATLKESKEELEAQNEFLTECLIELGNIIYA